MQKTKKCVYCDMDLKPHTMICKLCGRPQKLAYTLGLPIIIVSILVAAIALDKILPKEPQISGVNKSSEKIDDTPIEGNSKQVEVEKKWLGDVTITIPNGIFTMAVGDELTEEQKTMGFTKMEKLADGSIRYTIKKSKYNIFLKEYKQGMISSLEFLYTSGSYASVKNIKCNDNLSEITIIADKTEFENGTDNLFVNQCGLLGQMYQIYDVDAPQKVVVQVKDAATGKILKTEKFPMS